MMTAELWHLDPDQHRWAVVVDGRVRWAGSQEECQRRVDAINAGDNAAANGRSASDQAIKQIIAVLLFILIGMSAARADGVAWPVVPNPQLTPGETRELSLDVVCKTRWGRDARAVTVRMKARIFAAYGIPLAARHLPNGRPRFEIDHFLPRELAGADTERNLWAQPYTGPWNARLKDRLENRLHVEVCAGRLSLVDAQQMIRSDWREVYQRYFGPPR